IVEAAQGGFLSLLLKADDALEHAIKAAGADAHARDVGMDAPGVGLPYLARVAHDDQAVELIAKGAGHDCLEGLLLARRGRAELCGGESGHAARHGGGPEDARDFQGLGRVLDPLALQPHAGLAFDALQFLAGDVFEEVLHIREDRVNAGRAEVGDLIADGERTRQPTDAIAGFQERDLQSMVTGEKTDGGGEAAHACAEDGDAADHDFSAGWRKSMPWRCCALAMSDAVASLARRTVAASLTLQTAP